MHGHRRVWIAAIVVALLSHSVANADTSSIMRQRPCPPPGPTAKGCQIQVCEPILANNIAACGELSMSDKSCRSFAEVRKTACDRYCAADFPDRPQLDADGCGR